VHVGAVSVYKALPSLGKHISAFSNLERMKAQTSGRIKDIEERAIQESIKRSAMGPGFPKIIKKVPISTYFDSASTDLYIADNACCIDYSDTWSLKRVH
jgi:hypothetical protein